MFDVITIGAGVRDVFLVSKQFQLIQSNTFSSGVGECVSLGDKIEIDEIVHATGGGATNAAVTFARLGIRVAVACRVGRDADGAEIIASLKREKVGTSAVVIDPRRATAYSTILTTTSGERTVLVYRGASGHLSAKDIPVAALKTRFVYLTSLGNNASQARAIITRAAAAGTEIAWNPGMAEIELGLKALKPLLRRVSVLIVNREEGARLAGTDDLAGIMDALSVEGGVTLVTDGRAGAYARFDGQTYFVPGSGKPARSQTGAGDAFGSGFVAGYLVTRDVRQSLAVAMLNAQSVIAHVGAKQGILRSWPTASAIKSVKITTL